MEASTAELAEGLSVDQLAVRHDGHLVRPGHELGETTELVAVRDMVGGVPRRHPHGQRHPGGPMQGHAEEELLEIGAVVLRVPVSGHRAVVLVQVLPVHRDGRMVEVDGDRSRFEVVQELEDDVGQQRVRAGLVDVVERAPEAVVVEPAGLDAVAEEQLNVDMLKPSVHSPEPNASGHDVEDHHRHALGVRGLRQRVPWQVGVEHVHDAELVDARPDEREVANCEGADLEVVGVHGTAITRRSGGCTKAMVRTV